MGREDEDYKPCRGFLRGLGRKWQVKRQGIADW